MKSSTTRIPVGPPITYPQEAAEIIAELGTSRADIATSILHAGAMIADAICNSKGSLPDHYLEIYAPKISEALEDIASSIHRNSASAVKDYMDAMNAEPVDNE